MADYGLEVRNNNNIVIIDSRYKNHTYHSHGRSFVNKYLTAIDIEDITTTGILFLKPPDFYAYPYGFEKNGSVYDKIVIASDSTGYVDWIVYEEFKSIPASEYGLNVYDSSSSIIFSSDSIGYVNVIEEFAYTTIGSNLTVNDADNNYFALVGSDIGFSYSLSDTPSWIERTMRGFKRIDSTTINTDTFVYYREENIGSGGGGGSASASSSPKWFIEISGPPSI